MQDSKWLFSHVTALHDIRTSDWSRVDYITLGCVTLDYIALHYIALHRAIFTALTVNSISYVCVRVCNHR